MFVSSPMFSLTLVMSCCRYGQRHHSVAVPAAAAAGPKSQAPDMLDVHWRRVQAPEVRGSGQAVGAAQEQDQHELRQAEPSPALLLWQGEAIWVIWRSRVWVVVQLIFSLQVLKPTGPEVHLQNVVLFKPQSPLIDTSTSSLSENTK